MADEWTAPEKPNTAPSAGPPLGVVIPVLLCALLGLVGMGMTCYSGAIIGVTQAGLTPGVNPEQARLVEEIQAQQGWWVLPAAVLQLLAKMALSIGLLVGGVQVLRKVASGVDILKPTLLFGVGFEIVVGLWGLGSMAWNWETMSQQFAAQMAADPAITPELAQSAGSVFGMTMLVTMLAMLVWAVAKAALYGWTHRQLGMPAGQSWVGADG